MLAVAAAAGVWWGVIGSAAPPAAEPSIPAPAAGHVPLAEAVAPPHGLPGDWRLQGVATCTSVACHGGAESTNPDEQWRSAYTIWATRDRHARAYAVLFEERARSIVTLLDHVEARQSRPWRDARCLACHAATEAGADAANLSLPDAGAGGAEKINSTILADGVGCESCHGPAQRWLGEHTKATWPQLGDARYGPAWGMRDTANLRVRAETCVGCHVGAAAAGNAPARDVNHDLLAAGHPRLNFEFSSYLANLPRHWDARADHQRYEDFEARAWAVGRFVSLQAALELLADRASQAAAPARRAGQRLPPVWPDFSEFGCYSCHHQLRTESWRQNPREQRPRETLSWCSWYGTAIVSAPQTDGRLGEYSRIAVGPTGTCIGRHVATASLGGQGSKLSRASRSRFLDPGAKS